MRYLGIVEGAIGMGTTTARAQWWHARIAEWWAGAWRWMLMACGAAIAAYLILDRGIGNGAVTAAAVGGLVIGVVLTGSHRMAIPLLAMPALFIVQRAGFGGGDLTVSDVALAAAFAAAVLFAARPVSPPMRRLLFLNLVYQFATLLTVIVNPFIQDTVEWFHAWLLVSGALFVGWAVGSAGYARLSFILMLSAGAVIAVGTLVTAVLKYAHGDFSAVYPAVPWSMNKNFAGDVLAFGILIAFARPDWAGLNRSWSRATMVLLFVALITTQSRQAIVGLLVGMLLLTIRRGVAGHVALVVLLAIPGAVLIVWSVLDQIASQNKFNSTFQRLNWFREVFAFWKHYPIFGAGLRFWYVNPDLPYQPPQAELEVLASAGAVGLAAFLVMWIGFIVVLWRIDPRFGALAVAAVVSRIAQSQFDLFWVSAQVSIPFVIAGICLGAQAWAAGQPRGAPNAVAYDLTHSGE